MGEASRALAAVARLHALRIDDVHLPFGGEAMTRFGHPLPLSTREAYRNADAILVSSPDDPDARRRQGRPRPRLARLARAQPAARRPARRRAARRRDGRARDRARVRDRGGTAGAAHLRRLHGRVGRAGHRGGRRLGRPRRRAADPSRPAQALPRPPGDGRPGGRARTTSPARSSTLPRTSRAACTRSRAAGSRRRGPGSSRRTSATTTRSPASASRTPPARCSPPRCCSARASASAPPHARSSGPSPPPRQRARPTHAASPTR